MKVQLYTETDSDQPVWIDAYIDDDLGSLSDSDDMNILINGKILTIKIDLTLITLLKIRMG
tara:strand:- start:195 stop:377 length:183 start_codon:yes stop_codon:yes gene_type:complete